MTTSLCTLTCHFCGHEDDLDAFCRTPITGELPRGVYQCPKCRRAVKRVSGKPTVYASGFVAPGPVKLVEVGAVL